MRANRCDVIEYLITKMHWIVILTADEVCYALAHAPACRSWQKVVLRYEPRLRNRV